MKKRRAGWKEYNISYSFQIHSFSASGADRWKRRNDLKGNVFAKISSAYCLAFMENRRKQIGYLGENIAARYLEERGYKILFKNYEKPWGEIDIIAEKEGVLIFCEVKSNSQNFKGRFKPEERVNPRKLRHITRTASLLINSNPSFQNKGCRIDVISIVFNKLDKKASITHFKNV